MKKIGQGEFTKCYLNKNGKTVTLYSKDSVKECMALGWFPEHRLFPTVKFSEKESENEGEKVYEMEYFPRLNSIKRNVTARQWRLYKSLRNLFECFASYGQAKSPYEIWIEKFKTLPSEFKKEKEALIEAVEALTNYSTKVFFEISPRNVAVKGGRLILLDCFYIRD